MRILTLGVVLTSSLVTACGGPPDPSVGTPPPSGIVRVAVDRTVVGEAFFLREDRARLVVPGGVTVANWGLGDVASDTTVPAGDYILQAFSVFLSDTIVCTTDPLTGKATNCVQPPLQPGQVCELLVSVPAGGAVEATFTVLAQGRCRLAYGLAPEDPKPSA